MRKKYREQYLEAETAAALLGVSSRTLRRWKDEGAIARHSDGRYGLISLLFFAIERKQTEAEKINPQIALLLAQAEKISVEAEIKKQQLETLKDSLLEAEEAENLWKNHLSITKKKCDRLAEIIPKKLYEHLPNSIKNKLTQKQKDQLTSLWRKRIFGAVRSVHED